MIKLSRLLLFCSCLLLALQLQAQETAADPNAEERQKIWDAGGADFELSQVPEQWLEESKVVLSDLYLYNFIVPEAEPVYSYEMVRRRVKLLDKAAVEEYSELHFPQDALVGIRVEKQDGEVTYVEADSAIPYAEEVVTSADERLELGYFKYAIANLAEGDVLDFFYRNKLTYNNEYFQISEPVTQLMACDLPVVKQKIRFELPEQACLNFGSYNGAAEIQEVEDCPNKRCFEQVDTMRAVYEEDLWDYPYRSEPLVKFQAFRYASDFALDLSFLFLDAKQIPKSSISKKEISTYFDELVEPDYSMRQVVKDIVDYVERQHTEVKSPGQKASLAYYYFRHKFLFDEAAFGEELTDEGISDATFVSIMKLALQRLNVPHECIIAMPVSSGVLEELLLHQELVYLIEVPDSDFKYLFNFDAYTNAGDLYYTMEGADAYRVFGEGLHDLELPISEAEDNVTEEFKMLTLDEDLKTVHMIRRIEHKGHNRQNDWPVVLYAEDYHREYTKQPKKKRKSRKKRKREQAYQAMLDQQAEEMSRERDLYMKDETMAEMQGTVENYKPIKILSHGRSHQSPVLAYVQEFDIVDYIQKAGNNYLIDIGKTIGSQVEILEEGKTRSKDIRMPYARTFRSEVKLKIPEGYSVEGLESLNTSVANSAGLFTGTAVLEKGYLKINTEKKYLKAFLPKEDWPLILDFLEAAYNFTQQKVVLKPN